MSYLDPEDANRIITDDELALIRKEVENNMAIRCNSGAEFTGGAGYNLDSDNYSDNVQYATALYASICFSQDTIQSDMDSYKLLLLNNCSTAGSETYNYRQGAAVYTTFPKCGSLGTDSVVLASWSMNDSAITLARNVVVQLLSRLQ